MKKSRKLPREDNLVHTSKPSLADPWLDIRSHNGLDTKFNFSGDSLEKDHHIDEIIRSTVVDYERTLKDHGFFANSSKYCTRLRGHGAAVTCIAITRCVHIDKNLCATGSEDKTVIIWNLADDSIEHILQGHEAKVSSVALHSLESGVVAVSGSHDKTAIIWDCEKGTRLHVLSYHTDIVQVVCAFSLPVQWPGGAVCLGSKDRSISMWSYQTGVLAKTFTGGHNACVNALVVYCPKDCNQESTPFLVSGGNDNLVLVWDFETGNILQRLAGHTWPVTCLSIFIPPGLLEPLVVSGSADKTIIMWQCVKTVRIARKLEGKHDGYITSLHVVQCQNGDAPVLISADSSAVVIISDLFTGKVIRSFSSDHKSRLNSIAVLDTPETIGQRVMTVGDDCDVISWDISSKYLHFNLRSGHVGALTAVACIFFNDPCGAIVATTSTDKKIILWDERGKRIRNLDGTMGDIMNSLAFVDTENDKRPQLLISGGWDGVINVWDIDSGIIVKAFQFQKRVCSISFIRDMSDSYLLVGLEGGGEGAVLHDFNSMSVVYTFNCSKKDSICVKLFRTDDSLYAVLSSFDGNVYVVDVKTKCLMILLSSNPSSLSSSIVCIAIMSANYESKTTYLFGGSYDEGITCWDLSSGDICKRIHGNFDTVLSITTICNPNCNQGKPVIVAGCADCVVRLWDFETGNILQSFYGHDDKVAFVFGSSNVLENYPSVYSLSIDQIFCVWDLSYDFDLMPPRGHITAYFELDRVANDGKWSRIQRMSDTFGETFWLDNSYVFPTSAWYKDYSFIIKFRHFYRLAIRRQRIKVGKLTYLQYLFAFGGIAMMKILLNYWSEILNEPIIDTAHQLYFHLAFYIEKDDLIKLSLQFPKEFSEFICSIRLRPAAKVLYPTCFRYDLEDEESLISRCNPHDTSNLWKHLEHDKIEKGNPISVMFLPLLDSADLSLLAAYVAVSHRLNSVDIFNSDVGMTALQHSWNAFGATAHIKAFKLYLLFTATFSVAVYAFEALIDKDTLLHSVIAWVLQVLVLCFIMIFAVRELKQLRASASGISEHLSDIWNVLDILTMCSVTTGVLVRIGVGSESSASRSILAVASVLVWFQILYFLRAFSNSGPLVSMVLQIAFDIRFFLLVLLIVLLGFAQAFWILSEVDRSDQFGTIQSSLMTTFLFMLGGFNAEFDSSSNPSLSALILVLFLLFMTILMLNLLIALMGQSFSNVSEKGLGQWRLELSSIILEQQYLVEDSHFKDAQSCLYVLKYTSDLSFEDMIIEKQYDLDSKQMKSPASSKSIPNSDSLEWQIGSAVLNIPGLREKYLKCE